MATTAEPALPELESVAWRSRASAGSLRKWGRLWTAWTVASVVPFSAFAVILFLLEPLTFPAGILCLAQAWIVPELYAHRGVGAVRPSGRRSGAAESVAQGLLGDLLGHEPRELQRRTGLALESGRLGVWLVGEAGALLVPPGGRRVHCFCVGTRERELPASDRISHLLLALRTDELGFATVANKTFSGAAWRVRRRLRPAHRPALGAARAKARAMSRAA